MKITRFIWALVLMLLGITACTNQYALPLAEAKPTLLFFYTEN